MEFGIGLLGYAGCWDDAAYAEQHGYSTAGFVDSPLLGGDPFVCLALAAQATTRMRIGTFLAIPGNRSAATTASAIATVNRLAPGRVFLGLGSGYTSRNVFGIAPVAARAVARYAADCRALLAGEEAELTVASGSRRYRLLHREGLYVNTQVGIPVYIAADGPKALDVAGAAGDGWITTMQNSHIMATSPEVFATSLATIRAAAARAGRPGPSYTILSTGICLLDDGEPANSPRALEQVGPLAMLAFHSWADNPAIAQYLPAAIQAQLDKYERDVLARFPHGRERRHQWIHRGHLSHLLPGEAGVLTEEIVRMTTLTGTPVEVAATLARLAAVGTDNVSLWIPPQLTRQVILDVERRLFPLLASVDSALVSQGALR